MCFIDLEISWLALRCLGFFLTSGNGLGSRECAAEEIQWSKIQFEEKEKQTAFEVTKF